MTSERSEQRQSCKLFIGGLSWDTTGERLRSYFENHGVVREAFVSYNRVNGRPRGFGFVVFESAEVIDKVVSHKHTIDRREVEVKRAVAKDEGNQQDTASSLQANDTDHPSSGGHAGGNFYPPSSSDPSYPSQGGRSRKIFIGGLAPTVDDTALRSHFEPYGALEDVVVMIERDGSRRSRGFGFVTFASEESLDLIFSRGAIQTLHDKQIEIKSAVPREQLQVQPSTNSFTSHHNHRLAVASQAGHARHASHASHAGLIDKRSHFDPRLYSGGGIISQTFPRGEGGTGIAVAGGVSGGGGGRVGGISPALTSIGYLSVQGMMMPGHLPSHSASTGTSFSTRGIPSSSTAPQASYYQNQDERTGGGKAKRSDQYPTYPSQPVTHRPQPHAYPSGSQPVNQSHGYTNHFTYSGAPVATVAASLSANPSTAPPSSSSSPLAAAAASGMFSSGLGLHTSNPTLAYNLAKLQEAQDRLSSLSCSMQVGGSGSSVRMSPKLSHTSFNNTFSDPTSSLSPRHVPCATSEGLGALSNAMVDYSEAATADLNGATAGLAAAAAKFGDSTSFTSSPMSSPSKWSS